MRIRICLFFAIAIFAIGPSEPPATDVAASTAPAAPVETVAPATVAPRTVVTPHRLAAVPPIRAAASAAAAAPAERAEPDATTKPAHAASVGERATFAPTENPEATRAVPVATASPGDVAFARLSAAVVRQFLESLKRGDQDAAFAVLASPPKSETDLPEFGIVDLRTQVARVDAHGAANSDAFVSVQMDTPNGPYFGQYTVHKSETGAAVIVAHSIVKP